METMYDRIKRMDKHELAEFIYVIYQVGVKMVNRIFVILLWDFLVAVTSLMIM